jgi:hypothetical protein
MAVRPPLRFRPPSRPSDSSDTFWGCMVVGIQSPSFVTTVGGVTRASGGKHTGAVSNLILELGDTVGPASFTV